MSSPLARLDSIETAIAAIKDGRPVVVSGDDFTVRGGVANLSGAVDDAERFSRWVMRDTGGEVPEENVRLLLGRVHDGPERREGEIVPTKDNTIGTGNLRTMAKRAKAKITEVKGASHVVMVSQPGVTADVILRAATGK